MPTRIADASVLAAIAFRELRAEEARALLNSHEFNKSNLLLPSS